MKTLNRIMTLIFGVVMILTLSFNAFAIGFDAEKSYDSVFVITSGTALGSGFAIGENCIITNAHVIDNPKSTTVTTYSGASYKASVVAMHEDMDIAVLAVSDVTFPTLTVANYKDSKIGDDVYAIGAPNGMTYTLTKGTLSAKDRVMGKYSYIQIDAPLNHGNSGGPLLTDEGKVIGVNSMKLNDSEGIGLAIPMTAVSEYLTSLGIKLDANGNVVERLDGGAINNGENGGGTENPPADGEDPNTPNNENPNVITEKEPLNGVLMICLAASVTVNIILLVIVTLKSSQTQNQKPRLTNKDRTDFDIDIF